MEGDSHFQVGRLDFAGPITYRTETNRDVKGYIVLHLQFDTSTLPRSNKNPAERSIHGQMKAFHRDEMSTREDLLLTPRVNYKKFYSTSKSL